jgi:hypothetical protein
MQVPQVGFGIVECAAVDNQLPFAKVHLSENAELTIIAQCSVNQHNFAVKT